MRVKSLIVVLCIIFGAGQVSAADKLELKTQKDKISYSLGMSMGSNLKRDLIDIDADILARAIKDVLAGASPLMTEQEVRETIAALQKDLTAKQQDKMKTAGDKNGKEGEAFLVANKKKEGVKTLPGGLQYKVLAEGKGKSPKATDTVSVNYRGTLIDGTEFDSSYKRGQAATFPVGGVIKGWTEALQLMKEGAKWQLFIPANLAYGESGTQGGPIGPNATLIFEVELISIDKKEK